MRPRLAIELRDLVLEDEVVPERLPGQLAQESMVLVQIIARVGQDEVRMDAVLERLHAVLDGRALEREVAVAKRVDRDCWRLDPLQEPGGRPARLVGSDGITAHDHPRDPRDPALGDPVQDRPAAADLQVVRVGA